MVLEREAKKAEGGGSDARKEEMLLRPKIAVGASAPSDSASLPSYKSPSSSHPPPKPSAVTLRAQLATAQLQRSTLQRPSSVRTPSVPDFPAVPTTRLSIDPSNNLPPSICASLSSTQHSFNPPPTSVAQSEPLLFTLSQSIAAAQEFFDKQSPSHRGNVTAETAVEAPEPYQPAPHKPPSSLANPSASSPSVSSPALFFFQPTPNLPGTFDSPRSNRLSASNNRLRVDLPFSRSALTQRPSAISFLSPNFSSSSLQHPCLRGRSAHWLSDNPYQCHHSSRLPKPHLPTPSHPPNANQVIRQRDPFPLLHYHPLLRPLRPNDLFELRLHEKRKRTRSERFRQRRRGKRRSTGRRGA
jgi:hypothetical protein